MRRKKNRRRSLWDNTLVTGRPGGCCSLVWITCKQIGWTRTWTHELGSVLQTDIHLFDQVFGCYLAPTTEHLQSCSLQTIMYTATVNVGPCIVAGRVYPPESSLDAYSCTHACMCACICLCPLVRQDTSTVWECLLAVVSSTSEIGFEVWKRVGWLGGWVLDGDDENKYQILTATQNCLFSWLPKSEFTLVLEVDVCLSVYLSVIIKRLRLF